MGVRDLTVGEKRMSWYDPHRLMKLVAGMLLTRINPGGDQRVKVEEDGIEVVVIEEVIALETLNNFL